MEYKEIEGVVYCAYGIDISESTNIELLEKIFYLLVWMNAQKEEL